MISKKIFVAGHRNMFGSAGGSQLLASGVERRHLVTRHRGKLDQIYQGKFSNFSKLRGLFKSICLRRELGVSMRIMRSPMSSFTKIS